MVAGEIQPCPRFMLYSSAIFFRNMGYVGSVTTPETKADAGVSHLLKAPKCSSVRYVSSVTLAESEADAGVYNMVCAR